jgi:hypothetical protein
LTAHRRLFSNVDDITFTVQPYFRNSSVYKVGAETDTLSVDTVGGVAVAEVVTTYDTTNVEITMRSGRMMVYIDGAEPIEAWLGEQVFYLDRDPEDPSLWVIDKWFDMGNE